MSLRRHYFRHTGRVITALAGILLMLAGEAPLVAWAGEYAMECCPDGHACCRRLHHSSQQSGATLQGDFCGMPGCGGGALSTVSIPLNTVASAVTAVQLVPVFAVAVLLLLSFVFIQFKPELFQRPPPAFL